MLPRDWLRNWRNFGSFGNSRIRRLRRPSRSSGLVHAGSLEPRVLLTANAVGGEFQVNSYTAGFQGISFNAGRTVAMDADGDFVVTWNSDQQDGDLNGIYAQRFDATGVAQGSEFRVNTTVASFQDTQAVAMDADGDFVVVWASNNQDGNGYGIYGQRFNREGVRQGGEFLVNTFTTGNQDEPSVAMDTNGDFVVTWESYGQDGGGYGIFAQRFNAAGVKQGSELQINNTTTDNQRESSVGMDARGNFVISWTSAGQDGSDSGVYARRYSAAGVAQASEFRVNTTTTDSQSASQVALDVNGNFVVVWQSQNQDGDNTGIYAQRYNANAVKQGGEFRVNEYTTDQQSHVTLAMDADGDFVVAWQSLTQDGNGAGVFVRTFNAAGVAQGTELQVNTYTTDAQADPAVAMDADGDFVVAWESASQDGSNYGVYAQRFDEVGPDAADNAPPIVTAVIALDNVIDQNERILNSPTAITVVFSENMQTTGGTSGPNSVTNPANWMLTRNGDNIAAEIQSITFGLNGTTGQYEAVLTMTGPLVNGDYVLTAKGVNALRDTTGNALDGNGDGLAGGDFVRNFLISPQEHRFGEVGFGTGTLSDIAMDAIGNTVVTWTGTNDGGGQGIFARLFNNATDFPGVTVQVNVYTTGTQANSSVARDADGDFVVTWSSLNQDGSGYGIYARRYNAAGVAQGGEFRVNSYTTGDQHDSSIAMDASGDFIITWTSEGQDGSDAGIYGQHYNAAGMTQGAEFLVNAFTTGSQQNSSVATDADGDFVVAWSSDGQDGDGFGIYAQRFDYTGVAQGMEFLVNSYTTHAQNSASVSLDESGDFVIAWSSHHQDGDGYGIYAQRYDSAGLTQGSEFQVNSYTTSDQISAATAMDADGDFVVTWARLNQDAVSYTVYIQRYDSSGAMVGEEFPGNLNPTTGAQHQSAVAMDADGDFTFAWGGLAQRYFGRRPNLGNGGYSVNENRPVGHQVGFLGSSDPDPSNVTYRILSGNIGNAFALSPNGFITVASPTLDHEGISQYQLLVEANDNARPNGLIDTGIITININNLNEPPTFLAPTTFTVSENRPVGAPVGDVNAVDPENNSLTYSIIDGDPNGQFAIDPATGLITVAKATIDFETSTQYTLLVHVEDNGSPAQSRNQLFTVNITDLNEAPTFLAPTTFGIAENRSVGFVVGDVNTFDPEGNTVTYSIVGGDPNAQFAIDNTTGVITVAKATIDFEATPQFVLQVRAQDNGTPSNDRTQNVTVNIVDLNEAPVFLQPTTFTIAENRSIGYVVGDVNAFDPEGQTLTYSIVGGDSNAQFAINGSTGVITVAKATIDFEATPQFVLQIRAQDNGTPSNGRTQNITVNVTDLNEAPNFVLPTEFTIAENRSVGYTVGDVNAIDPEGQTLTYSIVGGDPNAQFAIDSSTGVITVAKATINFEATPQFVLQVRAQDNGSPSNFRTQNVTVNIVDLNEAPVYLQPTTFNIAENSPNGAVVGAVQTFDPEGQSVSYAITAGNTDSAFAIDASTGEITVNNSAALDFETMPQFVLSVQAVDNGNPANSRTQAITINLTNVIDASLPEQPKPEPIAMAMGASGEQVVPKARSSQWPPKKASPAMTSELYSFTLHEFR